MEQEPPTPGALEGRSIVVCRPVAQAESLINELGALGAHVVSFPLIEIVPPADPQLLERSVRDLVSFDWVCFTSSNAVAAVADALESTGLDWPEQTAVAVVGPATRAAALDVGLVVGFEPSVATAEMLARELPITDVPTQVLAPLAELAGPDLINGLTDRGARVSVVTAYRSVTPEHSTRALAAASAADAVVLTSGSTVDRLVASLGLENLPPVLIAIGPSTASIAAGHGLTVAAIAEPHTEDGLISALVRTLST